MNNDFNSGGFKTAMFADCLANSREIFQLIDQVFPLDSCSHYQVLPLKLDGNHLVLGMLDPNNEESKKFASSIAKVFKYELEVQIIDLQTHQIILANYPQNAAQSSRQRQDEHKTIIDTSFNPHAPLKGANQRRAIYSAPTVISHSAAFEIDEPDIELLSDLPADLDFLKNLDLAPKSKQQPAKPQADATATLFEIPPEFSRQNSTNNLDHKATIVADNPAELVTSEFNNEEIALGEAQISQLIAETLNKKSPQDLQPKTTDFLPQLLPKLSWQRLLEEAFQHHSEYIILTRYSDRGSIVTEKNNSVQSSLDGIPLPIFCSSIDEIKRMARLPQNTSSHPQKLVLERFYQQERILLRLEFSIQQQLETVRIQILRDRVLKTYEQQQIDRVGEQALELAKQLEKTLRRIQACFDSAQLTNLKELKTVHSRISHQLRLLDK